MVVSLVLVCLLVPGAAAGQSAAVAPIQVLKISSGPTGSDATGTFVLTSERSVFNRTDDREVIVIFQWQGRAGMRALVANWRSPDGAATSTSTIDYNATTERFGAVWTLPLTPSIALGTWSIEATVDGLPAGRYTFEVTDRPTPSAVARPRLSQNDLFQRLDRAMFQVRRFDADGRERTSFAAFNPGGTAIFTLVGAFDDASDVKLVQRDNSEQSIESLFALNRRQRWIALPGAAQSQTLAAAPPEDVKIGDRCFSMEARASAPRALTECRISGQTTVNGAPAFVASFVVGISTPGAPILNEFGDLIGIADDPTEIGMRTVRLVNAGGASVVTILRIGSVVAQPTAVSDLRTKGLLIPPVVDRHVSTGGIARADAKGKVVAYEHNDFVSVREPTFVAFIRWAPKERLRGVLAFRLYDADNRLVFESKPSKADLRPDRMTTSNSVSPVPKVPGVYRVDVLIDGTPMWRSFVTVTP